MKGSKLSVALAIATTAMASAAAIGSAAAQGSPSNFQCPGTNPTVAAGGATYCGASSQSNPAVNAFLGIDYAMPPVGTQRWQAPTKATLSGQVDARYYGSFCPQDTNPDMPPIDFSRPLTPTKSYLTMNEDCLNLNVWVPAKPKKQGPLPVMVFIHGGAFVTGGGNFGMYDGSALAAQDMVVVTLNYRLGALGFLVAKFPGNLASPAPDIGGNLGILDQQMALRWVKDNISAFGGDPGAVTLFGESAGAMSTGLHMLSIPTSKGLFNAAIMESNPMGLIYKTPSDPNILTQGTTFINQICAAAQGDNKNCAAQMSMDWLQSKPTVDNILAAQRKTTAAMMTKTSLQELMKGIGLTWSPVLDGSPNTGLIQGAPVMGYASTDLPRVPFAFGLNQNEATPFIAIPYDGYAVVKDLFIPETYKAAVADVFVNAGQILKMPRYQPDAQRTNSPFYYTEPLTKETQQNGTAMAMSNLVTDSLFACGNVAGMANIVGTAGSTVPKISGYSFQKQPPFNLYAGLNLSQCGPQKDANTNQVCHADELPYVFNMLTHVMASAPPAADTAVAAAMNAAWGNYGATTGGLNGGLDAKAWTSYAPATGNVTLWNSNTPGSYTMLKTSDCSLFELKKKS